MVDLTGLGPEDQARLLRVHDMLVAAGPPADLPSALAVPPAPMNAPVGAPVSPFPARRRAGAAILIAATVAAACFGGGYVLANQTHSSATHIFRVVQLQGLQNSEA